jgi:hypothetical protein
LGGALFDPKRTWIAAELGPARRSRARNLDQRRDLLRGQRRADELELDRVVHAFLDPRDLVRLQALLEAIFNVSAAADWANRWRIPKATLIACNLLLMPSSGVSGFSAYRPA